MHGGALAGLLIFAVDGVATPELGNRVRIEALGCIDMKRSPWGTCTMRRFKKILIDVSGGFPESAAVAQSAELARRNAAALKLIAVVEPFPWYTRLLLPASAELQEVLVREKSEGLESIAQPLRRLGLDVGCEVLSGRHYVETIREVLRGRHDLVVKVAEPTPGLRLGSTDMEFLRNCPCPVWMFKPGHGEGSFNRMLVAVDPAPAPEASDVLNLKEDVSPEEEALNIKLLSLATSLAEQQGAELHVLHAWSAPGESLMMGDIRLDQAEVEAYIQGMAEEAAKAVHRLVAKVSDPTGRRRVHVVKGPAVEVIPDFAKERAVDLIVLGTVARSGIPGFLIGNTAESVLRQVDCSVLAVKPDGFISPVTLGKTES